MTKIVNVYIFYDLDAWPRNPTNNLKFKNCLVQATNILKNSDKEKYIYSGYGITFISPDSWSFDNDFARNVITFGADTSSSSHSENRKNNFSMLGEGPTYGINGNFGSERKSLILTIIKQTHFFLSLHYNADTVICLLMEKKFLNLKPSINI